MIKIADLKPFPCEEPKVGTIKGVGEEGLGGGGCIV